MIEELGSAFDQRTVLVTGHTGFKGSWLSLWLNRLGARVYGHSLAPPTVPSMFDVCNIAESVDHFVGDIRDYEQLRTHVAAVKPDVVFHMAAQPIVRESYADPLGTFSTNAIGTANVLEAVRGLARPCAVVVVSSDKCYDNREWVWGYRENDPLGGKDPYSASKAATELVTACWRDSFFGEGSRVKLASARAGNVIGGGDWATDRIVPDCVRAFSAGRSVELRNPGATRPWQHVLEPLAGYLLLAAKLLGDEADAYCSGWNFGPAAEGVCTVETIVAKAADRWGSGAGWTSSPGPHPKEAHALSLNCDKAIGLLGWRPTWTMDEMICQTIDWYRTFEERQTDMMAITLEQIGRFEHDAMKGRGTHGSA